MEHGAWSMEHGVCKMGSEGPFFLYMGRKFFLFCFFFLVLKGCWQ